MLWAEFDVGVGVRSIGVAGAVFAGIFALWADAAQSEQLAMPYSCRVDRGRLIVTAAPSQTYEIVGVRAEMPFSSCVSRAEGGCRTFDVHSFDVRCGAETVAWVEIAAALAPHRLGRATIDEGRLNVRLEPRSKSPPDCRMPRISAFLDGLLAPLSKLGCDGRLAVQKPVRTVLFPKGFAPLTELGARLDWSSPGSLNGRPTLAVLQSSQTQPATSSPVERPAEMAGRWLTVVDLRENRAVLAEQASAEPPAVGPGERPILWVALALALAGALGGGVVAARQPAVRSRLMRLEHLFRHALRTGRPPPRRDTSSPEARTAADLESAAGGQIEILQRRAATLSQAQPLRRVLMREIERHRRRLEAARSISPEGAEGWVRHRNRLEMLMQDLVRLGDIVSGAERSLTATEGPLVAPTSTREAYEILGANPDVGERVLKKLVEALRACWHPDLARDDADRRQREERIKQINVAWDLIAERRVEG